MTERGRTASKSKWLGVGAALAVALGGAFFFMHRPPAASSGAALSASAVAPSTSSALGPGQSVTALSPSEKKYTDASTGFSFAYPAGFTISSFGSPYDASGETVLLQEDEGSKGLQVLVTPFDESVVLTAARIHHDLPQLDMADVSTRTVGQGSRTAQAVVFKSANSSIGNSSEAWFLYEKRLYQVSAAADSSVAFSNVLDSWQF